MGLKTFLFLCKMLNAASNGNLPGDYTTTIITQSNTYTNTETTATFTETFTYVLSTTTLPTTAATESTTSSETTATVTETTTKTVTILIKFAATSTFTKTVINTSPFFWEQLVNKIFTTDQKVSPYLQELPINSIRLQMDSMESIIQSYILNFNEFVSPQIKRLVLLLYIYIRFANGILVNYLDPRAFEALNLQLYENFITFVA